MGSPVRTEQDELTAEQIRKRLAERRGTRPPLAEEPPARRGQFTEEQVESRIRRRRLSKMIGRELETEGLIPPIAPTIEVTRPGLPEAEPVAAQPLEPARPGGPAPPAAAQPRLGGLARQPTEPRLTPTDMANQFKAMAQGIREFFAPRPPQRPSQLGAPAAPDVTLGAAGLPEIERRALAGQEPPREQPTVEPLVEPKLITGIRQNLVRKQQEIAARSLPSRVQFALGAGTIRFAEAVINPIDPSQRTFTRALENIQTGGGLVAPLDEHRNFLIQFGLGLAEYVPVLVGLQATGVIGAAGAVTASARAAVIGALETRFGRRLAVRIFEEALKESVQEGLSVALFESVIGRGAGETVGGRLQVFGEEIIAETGGVVLGFGFGAGRQVFRELRKSTGRISLKIFDSGIQNKDQIPAFLQHLSEVEGRTFESLFDELALEVDNSPTVMQSIVRTVRSGAGDIGTIPEIRAVRARGFEEAATAEAEAPIRAFATDLARGGTVREAGALRALRRQFPRLNEEDAAEFVADAFGVPRAETAPVDIEGRPRVEEAEPEAGRPGRAERDPRARAEVSSRLARLETRADRTIRGLEAAEAVPGDVSLEILQESADALITDAASLGENALSDRAARLSAKIRDLVENPPERAAKPEPEKPPEAPARPPEAVPPEPAPAPKKAAVPPRRVEPETPEAAFERRQQSLETEIAALEGKKDRSRREAARLAKLQEDLAALEPEVQPPAAEVQPPAAAPEPAAGVLPPAERLNLQQRAEIEEILPEARDLSDEDLAEELARLGIEPRFEREAPAGRRITDLTDDELMSRIQEAGQELPEAGPEFRERLLEIVDPGRVERVSALTEERRELRGRLAGEIRGRRGAEREALVDELTGLQNQKAFIAAKPRADADPEISTVAFDVVNLKAANDLVGEEAGDDLIRSAGRAVRQAAEESGLSGAAFRSGIGDEFKVFAPTDVAQTILARAQEIMGTPAIEGTNFATGIRGAVGATVEQADAILRKEKAAEPGPKFRKPEAKPAPAAAPEPKVGVTEKPEAERVGPKYEDVPDQLERIDEFGEMGITDEVLVERPDGSTARIGVQYAIVDAFNDISPSHQFTAGGKSVRNPAFVDELQPRERIDNEFIEKRARDPFTDDQGRQQGFDEELIVMRSPTPERGPPIVDEFGEVFGGNNRQLIVQRVYENDGVAAERLRARVLEQAESFGISREFVTDINAPTLVRVLNERPADIGAARALADDLNRTAIQAKTPIEEAVLASERMTSATVKFFEEAFPADATLRGFLRTPEGREFLRRLETDGAITAEQRKGLFDKEGDLNEQGRDFIENIIFARAIGSAESLERLSKSLRGKLLKAAPSIAVTSGKFNLRPAIQQAIKILDLAEQSGQRVRDIIGQEDLFGQQDFSPFAAQMAEFLNTTKTQKAVAEAFAKYAESAKVGAAEAAGQTTVLTPLNPREAFGAAFGKELLRGDTGTLDFAAEPTLAARKPTAPRLKPSEEQLTRLRERFGERTPEQIAATQGAFEERRRRRAERITERGEAKRAPVQRRGARKRGAEPPTPERERGPGESGGGRAGDESRDVNPPGEPGVARGQRQREQQKLKTKDQQKARERALEDERKRFAEATEIQELVSDVKKVRESIRGQIRAAAKAAGIADVLVDEQLRDISRIQSNLLDAPVQRGAPLPGFLVGNAPGTGKTFVGAGVLKEVLERRGAEARVLVVIPGKADGPIVKQWLDVGRDTFDFEMSKFEPGETTGPGVYHMSATGLGNQWAPKKNGLKADFGAFDLIIFDESHLFANTLSANRAFAARALRRAVGDHRILHLSATPFEFPWDMAYMENLRLWGPGRPIANFDQWLASHGVRKAKRKGVYYFVKSAREDVMRTLIGIRRQMMEAGVYSQRAMKMDKRLKNDFIEVGLDEPYGSYYREVMREIADLEAKSTGVEINLLRSARVTFDRRITELAKIPQAIELAKQFLDDGKSVAIFTGYKMNFEMAPRMAERFPSLNAVIESIDEQVRLGLERLVRDLGGEDVVAQVHGGITSGKKRANDITDFQSGKKKVLVATVDAGGTGLSLHDVTGKNPRVQINLTLPWTGKAAEQLAGRTYRFGSKSDTQMAWMGMDTPIERDRLRRVAMKMESMGALVQGKVDTDAVKLAEFDFLPEAEIQQHLFGYKKELGLDTQQTSLDFRGKPHQQAPTESAARRSLDEVHEAFLAALSEQTKAAGVTVQGTHPTPDAQREDLALPRPNQKIIKPSQIIGKAARRFAVRTFLGGIKQFDVAGRFKIVADLVRLRSLQNVRVAAHEFAHHVDKMFFGFLTSPKDVAADVPTHLLPFVDELKPLAYAGAKDEVTEGFAEFVAEYVTRPKFAAQQAPKFFKYFRDHLNRVAPKDLDTFDWMQQQVALFKEFPAAERVGSRVIIGDSGELGDLRIMPGQRFKKWFAKWMDFQTPARDMDQIMMLEDRNWRSLQMLARRTFGADPLAENMMFRGVMDFKDLDRNNKVTRVSKGLVEIFKPIDSRGKFDLFRYWTVARRAKELRSRGLETGLEDLLEDGTVDELLGQVQRSDLKKTFDDVWDELKLYQDALLKWLVDSENLSPGQVVAMTKMNEFFVPWHRLMSEPDHLQDWVAEARATGGQGVEGVVGLPPAVHFFKGSTRPIIDPIESIVGNTRYFTQLGFRKQVENAVAKFSNDVFGAEGHGRFITAIDPKLVAARFSVRQIKQALETFGIRIEDVSDEQLNELVTLFHPMNKRKDLPVFSAIIDGKRKWFQVNDPDTWTMMAGMNKQEFGWLTNLAITAKGVLRNGVVISPEFMVRNFIRDTQTAWIQTPARGKGVPGAIRKIPMTAAVEGLVESVKAGKLWDEFVASGAAGSALTQISRRSNQQYMKQLFGRPGISRHLAASHGVPWNARQVYRMVRDQAQGMMYDLQHVGSIFENANRLSTFRASREEGADFLTAGFAARNVSTDFAVHGAGLQAWRLSTAFLNPAAQGTARIARAFKERPLLTLARSSMLTFSSAALWWYNQQDPDYPEYSANIKSRYWIWRDRRSGTIFRIPKTYVYGDIFGSFLAEAFLDFAFDRDPDIVRRLGVVMSQAFGFTMVPTLALPAFELAINKSLYFRTPIESQSMREQLPKEFRSRAYTSEASRKLSQALARFAETADTKGLGRIGRWINHLNLSPVQFDHVIRGYFGTMGFDVWNDMPNLIRLGVNGVRKIEGLEPISFPPNARTRNHFFVRGFTIQFPTGSAESIRRYYDRRDVLNEIALRYSMLQSLADTDKTEDSAESALRAAVFFENHMEELLTAPLYEQAAARLAVMARQKANATTAAEVDQLNRDALEIARGALQRIGEVTPAEKQLLEQRLREVAFAREENRRLQNARDQIDLLVFRRQLRGLSEPTDGEADIVSGLIRAVPGITGSQRASLRRYYRGIRQGSIVEREFQKTPRTTRRRFLRQERR